MKESLQQFNACLLPQSIIEAAMAIKSTIFKADIDISNLDTHYYQSHPLTVSRHPSENDQRMMIRLLAFALNAHERLQFTKGLCEEDEPDLWQKSLSDEIEVWIDLGQPDEKRVRKACARADKVVIYTYNERSAVIWFEKIKDKINRFDHLSIYCIPDDAATAMSLMAKRNMQLQYMIQDGEVMCSDGENAITIQMNTFQEEN